MRLGSLTAVLVVMACGSGGANGPQQQQQMALAPPSADALPDGGVTGNGMPASDSDRLVVQLMWFASQIDNCTIDGNGRPGERSYDDVTMKVAAGRVPSTVLVGWAMRSAVSTEDDYTFEIDLNWRQPTIGTSNGRAQYQWINTGLGETDWIELDVTPGGTASSLIAYQGGDRSTLTCSTW